MGDYYTLQSPWYWVIQAFMILYGLSFIAYGVVILNTSVTHTYFPGTQINSYYSQRYVSLQWYALLFAAGHIFMYPFVMMMITFRRSHGWSIFWFSLIFILVVTSSYIVITLGKDYRYCNSAAGDQRDNLCNDKRWCCVPEVNNNLANACPIVGGVTCPDVPGVASVNDLHPDTDFLWVFWPNFVYLLADICIVMFFLGIFCVAPFPQKKGPKPSAPPLYDEAEEQFVKKPPQAPETSSLSQRMQLKYTKPE